jgi:L-2-hydroxycarboxylate dehydrogenase (NAD+)
MTSIQFTFLAVRDFIERTFMALELPKVDAKKIAHVLASADLQGSDGHGIIRPAPYSRGIFKQSINVTPHIKTIDERAAVAFLDGANGMGDLVMSKAADFAATKAK